MTDGEQLLLVLALVYLSGCFTRLNGRSLVLSTWWGRGWRIRSSDSAWGSSDGGLLMQNPVPGFGAFFLTAPLPVSISPDEIVPFNLQSVSSGDRRGRLRGAVRISDLSSVRRRGSALVVDGTVFADFGDPRLAHDVALLLRRMVPAGRAERDRLLRSFWSERFRLRPAKEAVRSTLRVTAFLRLLSFVGFVLYFGAFPACAVLFGVERVVLPCALAMLIWTIPICMSYARAARRIFRTRDAGIAGNVFKMAFCPPTALRAADLVFAQSMAGRDILPLAVLLLRGGERRRFVELYMRDLVHPVPTSGGTDDEAIAACLWQNSVVVYEAARSMPLVGRIVRDLDREPERESPGVKSYCPRCLAQLVRDSGSCPYCGEGVVLRRFGA